MRTIVRQKFQPRISISKCLRRALRIPLESTRHRVHKKLKKSLLLPLSKKSVVYSNKCFLEDFNRLIWIYSSLGNRVLYSSFYTEDVNGKRKHVGCLMKPKDHYSKPHLGLKPLPPDLYLPSIFSSTVFSSSCRSVVHKVRLSRSNCIIKVLSL